MILLTVWVDLFLGRRDGGHGPAQASSISSGYAHVRVVASPSFSCLSREYPCPCQNLDDSCPCRRSHGGQAPACCRSLAQRRSLILAVVHRVFLSPGIAHHDIWEPWVVLNDDLDPVRRVNVDVPRVVASSEEILDEVVNLPCWRNILDRL